MIILYTSLIFSCVWFGVVQAKKLQAKQKFFEDALAFFKVYAQNLSYQQKRFSSVVQEFLSSENVGNEFSELLLLVSSGKGELETVLDVGGGEIKQMLNSLGKVDENTEEKMLNTIIMRVGVLFDEAKRKTQKYASFSVKISLLVGALLEHLRIIVV